MSPCWTCQSTSEERSINIVMNREETFLTASTSVQTINASISNGTTWLYSVSNMENENDAKEISLSHRITIRVQTTEMTIFVQLPNSSLVWVVNTENIIRKSNRNFFVRRLPLARTRNIICSNWELVRNLGIRNSENYSLHVHETIDNVHFGTFWKMEKHLFFVRNPLH